MDGALESIKKTRILPNNTRILGEGAAKGTLMGLNKQRVLSLSVVKRNGRVSFVTKRVRTGYRREMKYVCLTLE